MEWDIDVRLHFVSLLKKECTECDYLINELLEANE
jgi:hypothetical protein